MNVEDIIKIAAAIVASLGGGAAIIIAVAKWCGDILAQKLLSNVEHRHEKEIEHYKATLQDMSVKFSAMVDYSMEIATKQYDMELEIYQQIWKALYEMFICLEYIYDFEHPVSSDPENYVKVLNDHCNDFNNKLSSFKKQVDSVAPFYRDNAYDLLCKIGNKGIELLNIFNKSISVSGMSDENLNKAKIIESEMQVLKGNLTIAIREYLFSLKKVPEDINRHENLL